MLRHRLLSLLALLAVVAPMHAAPALRDERPAPGAGQVFYQSAMLNAEDAPLTLRWPQAGGETTLSFTVPRGTGDGFIRFRLAAPGRPAIQQDYYIRPNPFFYVGQARAKSWFAQYADKSAFEEQDRVRAAWPQLPPATKHLLAVRLDGYAEGVDVWIDGRFIDRVPGAPAGGTMSVQRAPDVALIETGTFSRERPLGDALYDEGMEPAAVDEARFLALSLTPYARPGKARWEGFPAFSTRDFGGIPIRVAEPGRHIDVGLSRWLEEAVDPADFCDTYTTRSAFDGCPESIILRVPKGYYRAAHLLCAADPDPAKAPALALRVTRFGNHGGDSGGRGDAFADAVVRLPRAGEASGPRVRKVGETILVEENRRATVPLYLVSVPLPLGEISDLLGDRAPTFARPGDFLDLELTRELRTAVHFFAYQNCSIKPLGLPSGVHVFGLTLERCPVEMALSCRETGNVFAGDPKPSLDARLTNTRPDAFRGRLVWEMTDFHGAASRRALPVALGPAAARTYSLDLSQPRRGWFRVRVRLEDASGRALWSEPTTCALLPPDTRRAGAESPFGTWWFGRSHGGTDDVEVMGPLLRKLGMRHVCPSTWQALTPEQLARHKLSYSMAPWHGGGATPEKIDAFLKRHPETRWGMLFHETSFAGRLIEQYYPEILGQPAPELTPEEDARFRKLWQQAETSARHYREKHPGVKLSFGNSNSLTSVHFMRRGFPKEYVDAFGMEGVAIWKMPERQPELGGFQEVWWLKELRNRYGYGKVPVSSGYEWICRCTQPGALGMADQAALYARDALHALAYGFPSINLGLIEDCADSYSYTLYASSGFVHRYPRLSPKPSYVAFATLTQALDGARYEGALPTGSTSLYAIHFRRGTESVVALWTPRGRRQATLVLDRNAPVRLTDSMGNTRDLQVSHARAAVTASELPVYLTTAVTPEALFAGASEFDDRPPARPFVIDPLTDPQAWEVVAGRDEELETNAFDIPRREGKFALAAVNDPEKGRAMRVALLPQPEVPAVCPRYLVLRPKQAVTLPGPAERVGLWVKGNSSWGRVMWEFTDARGERWISIGHEPGRWNVSDWESRSYINFDGWRYLSMGLPRRYPGGHHGPRDRDWKYEGGDGVMDHPLTFRRLILEMRDQVVYLTEMVPVPDASIRVKELSAGLAE